MKPLKTVSRTTLLEHSKFLTVESHIVELPGGNIIEDWAWVITPDFVTVLAVTKDRKILCFRQYKYAIDGLTLAPVAGYIEAGEDPLSAARRELLEETGYTAKSWSHLGTFRTMANRGGGLGHVFLACDAHLVADTNSDDLEDQELLFLNLDEIEQAFVHGEFKEFSWSTAVALALHHLRNTGDKNL